jgi:copper resistance protein D
MSLGLRFVHVLGALVWIGGMLFVALVLVPELRRFDDVAVRRRLMHEAGLRFRAVGWIALGLLLASGIGNLWLRPYLLSVPRFHLKLGLVVIALALSALHDFVVGPRAGRTDVDPLMRARASWLARVNLVLVLAIVVLGLSLR